MTVIRAPLVVALLGSLACVTVRPLRDPAQSIPKVNPTVVFVTYNDNSKIPVAQPRVSGDSLFGAWQGLDEPVAVPLSAVRSIGAFQKDNKRTSLLIAGIAAAAAGAVWSATLLIGGTGACDTARGPTGQYGPPPVDAECQVK